MIAIGCDHGGYKLKEEIVAHLKANNVDFKDFGVYEEKSVDYPDIASVVCKSILSGETECGILVCGGARPCPAHCQPGAEPLARPFRAVVNLCACP